MAVNTFIARKDYSDYKLCLQSNKENNNNNEKCSNQLNKAINSASHIISRECLPYTEDLYKCFKHSFRLSFCDKEITEKLQNCHSDIYKLITS
ncbi:conserved Plasmodium protein, unknown function [Plasmodium relictum]|uniref:Uncharacterized protein n=1 Tax=Plasmodium relictum TaxID=85471 RepID=A0A1J1H8X8_PLARL|nr:conserved Plasmodium protein, unknown function [Plasmodium relictum]CRH01246.1 conserved Plasmodium protein, unknown function [Plasmodium relictum]